MNRLLQSRNVGLLKNYHLKSTLNIIHQNYSFSTTSKLLKKNDKDGADDKLDIKVKRKIAGRKKPNRLALKKDEQLTSSSLLESTAKESTKNKKIINTVTKNSSNNSGLSSISIPKVYPQLLAIPLSRRPLFPGFYKSIFLTDPKAIEAVKTLVAERKPYVGIFLTKNDEASFDVLRDASQVHDVGVFAQITNIYESGAPDSPSLTVVVFPHRRIKITGVVPTKIEGLPKVDETVTSTEKKAGKDIAGNETVTATATDIHTIMDNLSKDFPVKPQVIDDPILPENAPLRLHDVGLVNVENLDNEHYDKNDDYIKAITSEIINILKETSALNPLIKDQILQFSISSGGSALSDPAKLADFVAAICNGAPQDFQEIIESLAIKDRLTNALILLKKELANAKLQVKISRDVDKKLGRKQQEYYLMEQLKGIKKELGIDGAEGGKDKLVESLKKKSTEIQLPVEVKKVFDEELSKLQTLEPSASEYNLTRNYLDWIVSIPWGVLSKENFNLKTALEILDSDHYGLKDVKDRILEFIAVGKLSKSLSGKIICFVGPPGVGKTSIGKSIAKALGREFYRFSVGGLSDVAEIKGHRRTYVGAMPGKIIQALKRVKTSNPLIMIDEIDKIGKGHQGDPASALLELLDPEQNNTFLDHYMDMPIDMSKILFVCTANVIDTIPAPLLDRMEVITLSGYIEEEKTAIATKYLIPSSMTNSGLTDNEVVLKEDAVKSLIRYWCRESGVRNLKKQIDKVFRKAALKVVMGQQQEPTENKELSGGMEEVLQHVIGDKTKKIEIDQNNLKEYVGTPLYTSDKMYEITPPGVVMGLAWTSQGGSPLYMESVLESPLQEKGKPSFHRTGQLGDVMKESSTIAYTFAKSLMTRKYPENDYFSKAAVHLHVPEGATPKDGPSAGCTMATSLLSLALNIPVPSYIAMTGELTLTGKILKIGGLKEKTIAAKRSGITTILFPAANKPDWDELADYIKEGIEPVFVDIYDDIFSVVFDKKRLPSSSSDRVGSKNVVLSI